MLVWMFDMGPQYQERPARGALDSRNGKCKGPEAGMSLMVSRQRGNAGGLEGIEPGVEWRVGRWELQTGANSGASGVGFILSAQGRGRGLRVSFPGHILPLSGGSQAS